MGRRKIEIQPIHDDRNRTVTFIKRKAGLFKKAHELAVLCQVDVAVIILGSNNTFYEFSSVDLPELISYYNRPDLVHDAKQPGDFGNYVKKSKISLHDRRRKRPRDDVDEQDAVSAANAASAASAAKQEEDDDEDDDEDEPDAGKGIAAKKRKSSGADGGDSSPHFNPLQQHVQRQFQSLYAHKDREPPQRPVLRVQIPNNASCGGAIQSESSTPTSQHANPGLVSRTTSSVRRGAAAAATGPIGGPGDRGESREVDSELRRRELPPMFTGSPAFSHYLATPLQRGGGGGGSGTPLPPGRGFFAGGPAGVGPPSLHAAQGALLGQQQQQQLQQQQQQQQHSGLPPPPPPPASGVPPPGGVGGGGAAGELMPSPAMSSMFPDWRTNLPGAAHAPAGADTSGYGGSGSGGGYAGGSTGLTPYIVINNTPLGNRFFNFERRQESERDEE